MAKEIKVIQCPKCGSTQKVELKPDYYQCQNCNTEYFLDSNDININHNYNRTTPVNYPTPVTSTDRLKQIGWTVFIVVMVLFFIITWAVTNNGSKQTSNSVTGVPGSQKEYNWWHQAALSYVGAGQKLITVVAGQRDYYGDNSDKLGGAYVAFYDLLQGKELKLQRLTNINSKSDGDYKIKSFANGDMYIIIDKTVVYAVDKSSYTVNDVTKSTFQNQTELVSGIANVEFIYDYYGDGFNITTNDGKNLYYFPIANKVYTKEEFYKAEESFATLLPGATDKVGFAFSRSSNDYPQEKRQLIKYVYKDNSGGPKEDANFQWATRYGAMGENSKVFTNKDRYRLISYDDFTPDRMYFDPYVLFSSDDYVLIKYKKTAAEKSPWAIQCLNAKTRAIVFTTTLTEDIDTDGVIKYKDGFVVKTFFTATAIGMDGKIVKTFKMN